MEVIDINEWRRNKMSHWEKNAAALKEMNAELYDKVLKEYENGDFSDVSFITEMARDGSDILGIMVDNRKVMLNSTYRPLEEAEKFTGKIQYTENSVTMFFGMGNGMILSEIMDKMNAEALVFLYEPSVAMFCYVLEHFDMEKLLSDKRLLIYLKDINDDQLSLNFSSVLTNVNVGVTTLEAHPKYKDLYPEEYAVVKDIFSACRTSALTNLNTMIQKTRLMTGNAISNISYFLRSKLSTDFVGKFPSDMPAIIVSGGPSLDKNYAELKNAKGKALIIAMDRTAKYLLDRGIEPDLFCSLDFRKSAVLFQDERLKEIPFMYIPDLSHNVLQTLDSHKLIYGTGDFKFYEWMLKQNGRRHIILPLGGSVATFAFGFAREMGFRRIILVGQDLALTGGKVYPGGMVNKVKEAENFDRLMVPGNVEDMVETRGDFYVYLTWFKQMVKETESYIEVINATEGGARIDGTKVMSLKEAIDQYCVKEYDIAGIFEKEDLIFPGEKKEEMYHKLEWKRTEILALKGKLKKASEAARRCHVLTGRGDFGREFKKNNKILAGISELFDEDAAANLVYKYCEHLLLKEDMDLYVAEEDNTKEMLRLYHKLEYDYQQMHDNIEPMLVQYDAMLVECRKELGINEE